MLRDLCKDRQIDETFVSTLPAGVYFHTAEVIPWLGLFKTVQELWQRGHHTQEIHFVGISHFSTAVFRFTPGETRSGINIYCWLPCGNSVFVNADLSGPAGKEQNRRESMMGLPSIYAINLKPYGRRRHPGQPSATRLVAR